MITRRRVIYVCGYDPQGPQGYYALFASQLKRACIPWHVKFALGPLTMDSAGGPGNPLGARAMNLGATVYRIHGTNAPETIGQAVSSGCFRLVNDDVADLYSRVPLGTKVLVQHQ